MTLHPPNTHEIERLIQQFDTVAASARDEYTDTVEAVLAGAIGWSDPAPEPTTDDGRRAKTDALAWLAGTGPEPELPEPPPDCTTCQDQASGSSTGISRCRGCGEG